MRRTFDPENAPEGNGVNDQTGKEGGLWIEGCLSRKLRCCFPLAEIDILALLPTALTSNRWVFGDLAAGETAWGDDLGTELRTRTSLDSAEGRRKSIEVLLQGVEVRTTGEGRNKKAQLAFYWLAQSPFVHVDIRDLHGVGSAAAVLNEGDGSHAS